MVWLMRCGSDTESVLLVLISTEEVGGGVGGGAGLRASKKRLRDDGRVKDSVQCAIYHCSTSNFLISYLQKKYKN